MHLFIEDVVVVNFVINLTLILIISNCLKLKTQKFKLAFSCLFATIVSLICGMNLNNVFIKYLFELLVWLFVLSFSLKNLNKRKLTQSLILLFVLSNLYSGMLQTFGLTFKFGLVLGSLSSSIVCLLILGACAITISRLLNLIVNKQKIFSNICKVEINFKGKKICTYGYFDTGNNLSHNTLPVSIVNFKLFENLTDITLTNLLSKDFNLDNSEYIKTSTLTGCKNLLMFSTDNMIITKNNKQEIITNPKFALSLNLQNNKDYDIILNNQYI